ncbi:MAG: hypothetical protein ABSG74_12725 [Candidatus Bathyarchaeia archaeon]
MRDGAGFAVRDADSNLACDWSAFVPSYHNAGGLGGQILRTEIHSIHGFCHVFFGIGFASAVVFLRPRSNAKFVITPT